MEEDEEFNNQVKTAIDRIFPLISEKVEGWYIQDITKKYYWGLNFSRWLKRGGVAAKDNCRHLWLNDVSKKLTNYIFLPWRNQWGHFLIYAGINHLYIIGERTYPAKKKAAYLINNSLVVLFNYFR
jgi:hypothetical protein